MAGYREPVGKTAEDYEGTYTEPELRERLKEEIKAGDRGGKPGQWSARKSQLLTTEYEAAGGGYVDDGELTDSQRSLRDWTDEDWQTADGDGRARQDDGTVRRYLPAKAWEQLSDEQRHATDALKLDGSEAGEQHVGDTDAAKAARRLGTVLEHYDDDSIGDLERRLGGMGESELRAVLAHEREHKDRKGAEAVLERELREAAEDA